MTQATEPEKEAILKHWGLRRGLVNVLTKLQINPETSTFFGCSKLQDDELIETLHSHILGLRKRVKELEEGKTTF